MSFAAPALASGSATVPLGSAVWWACMRSAPSGPAALHCPVPFDARYAQIVSGPDRPFDVIVPENEMKMRWLQPKKGQFDFAVADELVGYAQERGMRVRGHVLVFGKDLPSWMAAPSKAKDWTRATLLAALQTHITTVMDHYRDRFPGIIREWDVVNEAFDDNGNYDRNLLAKVIGPDYIEQAFRFAHAADPDAVLFYNEFNADAPNPRSAAVLRMAKDFIARGVPLDGIGLQMHLGLLGPVPSPDDRATVMNSYADLGLRVAITELDIGPLRPFGTITPADQGAIFQQVAQQCATQPACTGMTVWGLADALSWRGVLAAPLLIDAQYEPKPALASVQTVLAAAPARAPLLRLANGPKRLASVPVIDTRSRQFNTTLAARGLRVNVVCPGTPPCSVALTFSLRGVRLATRQATIVGRSHTLRMRMSKRGEAWLRGRRGTGKARLRAQVAGGPFIARSVQIVAPPKAKAAGGSRR